MASVAPFVEQIEDPPGGSEGISWTSLGARSIGIVSPSLVEDAGAALQNTEDTPRPASPLVQRSSIAPVQ
jgi:hypothetical protein